MNYAVTITFITEHGNRSGWCRQGETMQDIMEIVQELVEKKNLTNFTVEVEEL